MFVTGNLLAQDRYGLTFGVGTSKIDYLELANKKNGYETYDLYYENLLSWNCGFYYIKSVHSKSLDIGGELLVKGMGSFMKYYDDTENNKLFSYRERLIYLSLPIFIRIKINNRCYIQPGLSNSILLNRPELSDKISTKKYYELGGDLTFGVSLSHKINLEIKGYHGFTHNSSNIEGGFSWMDTRLFNSSFTLSLQYELGQRK